MLLTGPRRPRRWRLSMMSKPAERGARAQSGSGAGSAVERVGSWPESASQSCAVDGVGRGAIETGHETRSGEWTQFCWHIPRADRRPFLPSPAPDDFVMRADGAVLVGLEASLQQAVRVLVLTHPGLTLAEEGADDTPVVRSASRYTAEDLLALAIALRSTIALYAKLVAR